MKCNEIKHLKEGITELLKLQSELRISRQNQSLLMQVSSQLQIMKGKFIKEIYKIYKSGT